MTSELTMAMPFVAPLEVGGLQPDVHEDAVLGGNWELYVEPEPELEQELEPKRELKISTTTPTVEIERYSVWSIAQWPVKAVGGMIAIQLFFGWASGGVSWALAALGGVCIAGIFARSTDEHQSVEKTVALTMAKVAALAVGPMLTRGIIPMLADLLGMTKTDPLSYKFTFFLMLFGLGSLGLAGRMLAEPPPTNNQPEEEVKK